MSKVEIRKNVPLAPYTVLGVGGPAEFFAEASNADELIDLLKNTDQEVTLLGYGSNTLVSDNGVKGLVICAKGGQIKFSGNAAVVGSGAKWDDVVLSSVEKGLWGAELMSEIPGSVGAAIYINITAYGQSIGPLVEWVDTWDKDTKQIKRIEKSELVWDYKSSIFQSPENSNLVIIQAKLSFSNVKTTDLEYQRAIDVADELLLDVNSLYGRREIITEARRRTGSILDANDQERKRTVGSFFRNPIVTEEQADLVMSHDETGKTKKQIELMNQVHGGSSKRVSAAHVMLAAGFKRGQSWGNVKLNDQNLLKIEANEQATASEIHHVIMHIKKVCSEKLGITIEPEAKIIGEF